MSGRVILQDDPDKLLTLMQRGVNAPRTWLVDIVTGLLISAPVFWMFTQFLAINLPGLTGTGWL